MDATQVISDSILESDENEHGEEYRDRGRALAKLCILNNQHIPETELPLFLGDNTLGRDPSSCTLTLPAPSVSKNHAAISISVYQRRGCHSKVDMEALVWDLGSMNGTRKGRLKLTPHVRYALSEGERLVVADVPCQYVSCGADPVSSQEGTRTPGSRSSAVKDGSLDASGEKLGDTRAGNNDCVNGDTKARASLKKTPVRGTCLSFEQTPIQPQGTLVPESDTDSDSERGEGEDKRRKALASESDSHKSSPSSSSFLSPPNKIVPESEDESPITPSSSTSKRSYRRTDFSKNEADVEVEKKMSPAVVHDSVEEEDGAGQGGTHSKESGQHEKRDISLTGEDKQPVSASDIYRGAIPLFNMDSDTDVEEEGEEAAPAGPLQTSNQQAAQPPNTVLFHMDSDTDVDEDVEDKAAETPPSSENTSKLSNVAPVIQPEGSTMDSDTDVDDDDAVSGAAASVKATSCQRGHTADSAFSVQPRDFHLDSDTDNDEEDEGCGTKNKNSETAIKSDGKLVLPKHAPSAPHSLHLDGNKKAIPAHPVSEPSVTAAVSTFCATANAGDELDILSDSDTDMEGDSLPVLPVGAPSLSAPPGTTSEEAKSDFDADTDVDECTIPNPREEAFQTDCRGEGDADVEDKEADIVEGGEDLICGLLGDNHPGSLVPLLQNCSTPVQASGGEVEDMETQAFTSPSSGAFRHKCSFTVRPFVSSSCSDSQEEEYFVVAETQPFVFQTGDYQSTADSTFASKSSGNKMDEQCSRRDSFQLGLSDSSHLQRQGGALATESTQAFISVEREVNLEDTQAFAAMSAAGRSSAGHDSKVEATQGYDEEELARCSEVSEKQGCVDLALEATQAYISEPYNDPDEDSYEDGKNAATTGPSDSIASSTLAMAETQPMLSFEGQNSLETSKPSCSIRAKSRAKKDTEETDELGKMGSPQEKHRTEAQFISETQPMYGSDDEQSDDAFLDVQKKLEQPQQLDKQRTQPHTCSASSLSETQPLNDDVDENQPTFLCENDQTDAEDSTQVPRKRKAKQLHIEEEETQQLTNSEFSVAETQPMAVSEDDDADSMIGPRKRKAKPLQLEDETQSQVSSEVSAVERDGPTQPVGTSEDAESDNEDSFPGPRKRKAKQLHLEEEDTQRLANSEASAAENQPLTFQDGDSDSIPGLQKSKTVPVHIKEEQKQPLNTEVSAAETNPVTTDEKGDEYWTSEAQKRQAKQLHLHQDKETQLKTPLKIKLSEMSGSSVTKEMRSRSRKTQNEVECSVPADRQTKRENTALPSTRGIRGRDRSDDNNEEEMMQTKQTRGRKITGQQEDDSRADQRKSLTKEQQEGKMDDVKFRQQGRKETEKERKKSNDKEWEEVHQHKTGELQNAKKVEPKVSVRGRRAGRRTITAQSTAEPQQDSTTSSFEDFPARRTRSRSNSSNSVSSERSAPSANTQESKARGRGRGTKRGSEAPQTMIARSRRRITVAAGPTEQNSNELLFSRGNSNSTSSEISGCGMSSQNRGRGGRQRGRGRRTEPNPNTSVPVFSESHQSFTAEGRRNSNAGDISGEVLNENDKEKADSQKAGTSRGQQQANAHGSEPSVLSDEGQADQGQELAALKSTPAKRNVRGKGQKLAMAETVEKPAATAVSDGHESRNTRKGKKSELEANTRLVCTKVSKQKESPRETVAAEEGAKDEPKKGIPATVQPKRTGRASSTPVKKNTKKPLPEELVEDGEKVEQETIGKRSRGRTSVVQRGKKEGLEDGGTSSTNQDADMETSEQPQTPVSRVSRKRQAPADSPAAAKTRRSLSASPAASTRIRAGNQAYKVLFTGVVDEDGERVLARLGGSMAKGVADMNCLVTDKVRRTVKFLCAVAKGVPIVTTDWLEKSGKAGCFLSPNAFIVTDPEQETKFSFCLQESLKAASSQPLLQGYEIHVTKSVKPEPVHMKDIIASSGAAFLPKMPTSHKPQTVVISCEEDLRLCGPALSASLPIVSAEFILTGILQQKLDFQTHALSPPVGNAQPAGCRGRGRRKI
ncbi:mediator of DNA damage checkpoint protein 1 [Xenentodon cancila]